MLVKSVHAYLGRDKYDWSDVVRKSIQKTRQFLTTPFDVEPRIHVLTAGDFAQLPPVFEKYLFEYPAELRNENTELENITDDTIRKALSPSITNVNAYNITAFHLWKNV